jgi:hypothetical protein
MAVEGGFFPAVINDETPQQVIEFAKECGTTFPVTADNLFRILLLCLLFPKLL